MPCEYNSYTLYIDNNTNIQTIIGIKFIKLLREQCNKLVNTMYNADKGYNKMFEYNAVYLQDNHGWWRLIGLNWMNYSMCKDLISILIRAVLCHHLIILKSQNKLHL